MRISGDLGMNSIKIRKPLISGYDYTEVMDNLSSDMINDNIRSKPPLWAEMIEWFFNRRWRSTFILMGLDLIGIWFGILAAVIYSNIFFKINEPFSYYIYSWISYTIFIVMYIYLKNGYSQIKDRRSEEELAIIVVGNILAVSFTLTTNFIIRKEMVFSRHILLLAFFLSLCFILILRFIFRELLRKLWEYGLARENVLIVGYSVKHVKWLLEHLRIQRYNGFNIIGS